MPSELTRLFVPITDVIKTTVKTSDGIERPARLVRGIMTEEKLDLDQQIVDYDWAKKAAGDWFSKWGNIREQHSQNAVGKGKEIDFDDANRRIILTSKIVDADAIVKIDEDIYTGYSIGIKGAGVVKDAKAPAGRINRGTIVEDSIVDHPALETAKFAVVKMQKGGGAGLGEGVELLTAEDEQLLTKVAEPDGEKNTVVQVTVWADGEQVASVTTADEDNPLDGTVAEPAAARVETAVDSDLGGSLNPVEPTGDKTVTPQITKSEEDIDMLFAKAFTEVKDLLTKGDTNAALALIAATEALSKSAAVVEPVVTEPVVETPVVEPSQTTDKAASADVVKAAISEAVTKAVETAVKPLMEKVEAMEKRAAPGGPLLSGTRMLSAPEAIKGQFAKDRIEDIQKMAAEHPDGAMRQGARELLAEITKSA